MAKLVVVTGATLECSEGTGPSTLIATAEPPIQLLGITVASVLDHKPSVNVKSFQTCKIKKKKGEHPCTCKPETPEVWTPGATSTLLPSASPVLTEASTLKCKVGGTISIVDSGQSFSLSVNAADVLEALSHEWENATGNSYKLALGLGTLTALARTVKSRDAERMAREITKIIEPYLDNPEAVAGAKSLLQHIGEESAFEKIDHQVAIVGLAIDLINSKSPKDAVATLAADGAGYVASNLCGSGMEVLGGLVGDVPGAIVGRLIGPLVCGVVGTVASNLVKGPAEGAVERIFRGAVVVAHGAESFGEAEARGAKVVAGAIESFGEAEARGAKTVGGYIVHGAEWLGNQLDPAGSPPPILYSGPADPQSVLKAPGGGTFA
jgi:hypothetical protein